MDRQTDVTDATELVGSYARARGAQLSAEYTVNTYRMIDVWFSQRAGYLQQQQQKTIALGKPDVDLFIARTYTRHATDTTYLPAKVTVPS